MVILSEGPFSTTKPVPKELGTYEYKPIGRIWRSDTEHGSWIPVFDWVLGRRGRQAPSLMDLPEMPAGLAVVPWTMVSRRASPEPAEKEHWAGLEFAE